MNSNAHRTRTLPLIVVLGVTTAFDAMAIDLYLRGFRDIRRSLGANPRAMQTSLSVFVDGAAIGQLFYGPVADRFGRRRPLAFGILLFVLAWVLAALSQNMAMFMLARELSGPWRGSRGGHSTRDYHRSLSRTRGSEKCGGRFSG
jgi:MFS transporter, DHA1 family, multidrug resistance protein